MTQYASSLGKLKAFCRPDRWSWITLVFGAQVLGMLIGLPLLHLGYGELAGSILILVAGTLYGLVMQWVGGAPASCSNWKWWVPAIIYAAFIFSMSHRSFAGYTISVNTNVFHPVEYLSLGLCLGWVWHSVLEQRGVRPFATRILLLGMLFALSDEFHQSFIPGRDPSVVDLCLDGLGLSLGVAAFVIASRARRFF